MVVSKNFEFFFFPQVRGIGQQVYSVVCKDSVFLSPRQTIYVARGHFLLQNELLVEDAPGRFDLQKVEAFGKFTEV